MHEACIIENEDVAWIQLALEDRLANWLPFICDVFGSVEIRLGPFALAVKNIKDDEFLIVAVRLRHDVRESAEQVDAKSTGSSAPTRRDKAQEGTDELLRLRVVEQPDPSVHAPAWNASAICDGDRAVLPHMKSLATPPVTDDVSRPLSIWRPVTGIVTNVIIGEESFTKKITEFDRKSDFVFRGQDVTLTSQSGPDVAKVWQFPIRIIAHVMDTRLK
jgi:hypothetical protein